MDSDIGWFSSITTMMPVIAGTTSEGGLARTERVYTSHYKWDEGKKRTQKKQNNIK